MGAVVSAGTIALAFVAGHGILDGFGARARTRVGIVRIGLACALGATLLTPVLVLTAQASYFVPEAIGGAGWAALGVWLIARRRTRWRIQARWTDAVLVAAAVAFVLIAWHARGEPWGAGRDQQVYATSALSLVSTHSATSRLVPSDEADERLLAAVASNPRVERYLGMQRDVRDGALRTTSYLPIGWTVWLAIAAAIGGLPALYLANIGICAVAGILVFPVLRRSIGPILAVAAAIVLLALPSTRWVSGVTLSEPLTMLAFLAVAALVSLRGSRALWWVGPLMFGMSCIRIDALAISPMLILAAWLCAPEAGSERRLRAARRLAANLLAASVATVGWYAVFSRSYLRFNEFEILAAVALTAVLTALAYAPDAIRVPARQVLRSRTTRTVVPAIAIVALVYGAIVRPEMPPFSLIQNGSGLDGMRDFREDSVRDLATYLGWPLLVLAATGAVVGVRRLLASGQHLGFAVWVISGVGMAALYLTAPLVSPDFPWAIRRMIPVIIPCACMFAAIAIRRIFSRVRILRRTAPATSLVAAGLAATVAQGTTLMALRENAGMGEQIAAVAAKLPDATIVCDLPLANVCQPMAQAFDRRVVVVDASDPRERKAIAAWFERKAAAAAPAWLLHTPMLSMTGARAIPTNRWRFARTFIVPTSHPPAHQAGSQWIDVDLSRIDGLDPRVAWKRFGGAPVWGLADQGFYEETIASCGLVRMTDGAATIEVPADLLTRARFLTADFFSWAPHGEARETTVRVAGREAWHGTLQPGISSVVFPLPELASRGTVPISILSATFDPRVLDRNDPRTRVGIGLLGFRALSEPITNARPDAEPVQGELRILRSVRSLTSGASGSFALGLTNRGGTIWNSPHASGAGSGVTVGVRWYRAEDHDRVPGQARFDLPLAMLPGDYEAFEIPLVARSETGQRLPPATYDVVVALEMGDRWLPGAGKAEFQVRVTQ